MSSRLFQKWRFCVTNVIIFKSFAFKTVWLYWKFKKASLWSFLLASLLVFIFQSGKYALASKCQACKSKSLHPDRSSSLTKVRWQIRDFWQIALPLILCCLLHRHIYIYICTRILTGLHICIFVKITCIHLFIIRRRSIIRPSAFKKSWQKTSASQGRRCDSISDSALFNLHKCMYIWMHANTLHTHTPHTINSCVLSCLWTALL